MERKKRMSCREKLRELHSIIQSIYEQEQTSYKQLEAVSNIEDLDSVNSADFKWEVEEEGWKKLRESVFDQARQRMYLQLELYAAVGLPTEALIAQENRWQKLMYLLNQDNKDI